MDDSIVTHIGLRIGLLRRSAGLSLGALAQKVGKSRKTLYNYELGRTAMDIDTLYRVADALNVTLFQLIDFGESARPSARIHPFLGFNTLYMYQLQDGEIYRSVIKSTGQTEDGARVALYYKVHSPEHCETCSCIYLGEAFSEYSTLSFIMRNYFNKAENILINFSIRNPGESHMVGLISKIEARSMIPVAFKVVVSGEMMEETLARELLAVSPESYRRFRMSNVLWGEDNEQT